MKQPSDIDAVRVQNDLKKLLENADSETLLALGLTRAHGEMARPPSKAQPSDRTPEPQVSSSREPPQQFSSPSRKLLSRDAFEDEGEYQDYINFKSSQEKSKQASFHHCAFSPDYDFVSKSPLSPCSRRQASSQGSSRRSLPNSTQPFLRQDLASSTKVTAVRPAPSAIAVALPATISLIPGVPLFWNLDWPMLTQTILQWVGSRGSLTCTRQDGEHWERGYNFLIDDDPGKVKFPRMQLEWQNSTKILIFEKSNIPVTVACLGFAEETNSKSGEDGTGGEHAAYELPPSLRFASGSRDGRENRFHVNLHPGKDILLFPQDLRKSIKSEYSLDLIRDWLRVKGNPHPNWLLISHDGVKHYKYESLGSANNQSAFR
ncbi:hypothetical protein BDK51DRAFT_41758 [Blyttiomyces helicus]|uniref:Uncharacterized protein n=1 Tax=Blyttiomyces helicus TaxID=388810 RepID=A0A4P9WP03_9FUNG|nr:hypothetical protein BDK51DRAFT_41758 [Blyttiomyces helicus]|eukprot:RKO92940.1 hypothetical protein BDK51DRAFT_41758 [Blyttiomyces helicus]